VASAQRCWLFVGDDGFEMTEQVTEMRLIPGLQGPIPASVRL